MQIDAIFGRFVNLLIFINLPITYGAKLLNADWLRQRVFFLNHEGTFGNQEGMITRCWLAEHACIKLVSRFKRPFWKGISETYRFWVWSKHGYFILTWKRINMQQSEVFWWKSKRIFPTKTVLIRSLKNVWVGTAGVARSIELQYGVPSPPKVKVVTQHPTLHINIGVCFVNINLRVNQLRT